MRTVPFLLEVAKSENLLPRELEAEKFEFWFSKSSSLFDIGTVVGRYCEFSILLKDTKALAWTELQRHKTKGEEEGKTNKKENENIWLWQNITLLGKKLRLVTGKASYEKKIALMNSILFMQVWKSRVWVD